MISAGILYTLCDQEVLKFDNFTRATCISYIDLVEILNFQLRHKFG